MVKSGKFCSPIHFSRSSQLFPFIKVSAKWVVLCWDTQTIAAMGKAIRLSKAQPALEADRSRLAYTHTDKIYSTW